MTAQDLHNKPVKKAVFPVAGLGTRFLPATKVLPKEMLPLVDRPLIQRAVEEAQEAGIEEFIFITGRGKSLITQHFDLQPELIQTLKDSGKDELLQKVEKSTLDTGTLLTATQQSPMGLGHAVWCARKLIGDEPFALFLPDVMILSDEGCTAQMMRAYDRHGGNIIATANVPRELTYKYGIVDVGGAQERLHPLKGWSKNQPRKTLRRHFPSLDVISSSLKFLTFLRTSAPEAAKKSSSPTRCKH